MIATQGITTPHEQRAIPDRPNILLMVSDQERQRDWLPTGAALPSRQRLIDDGIEFRQHYTHSSPCSPSRATLFTGRYMTQHGVTENSTGPANTQLSTDIDTLGHMLRREGYRTAYKGKWHLEATPTPRMDAYGFGDWEGNDSAWWGLPNTGVEFDDTIADQGARWLDENGSGGQPWFLAVALVNPHDIMWFPMDQSWWADQRPAHTAAMRARLSANDWGRADNLPLFDESYDHWFDQVPDNFDDDLHTKPEVHRRWMFEMLRQSGAGEMRRDDHAIWCRMLDYYVKLHEVNDLAMGKVLNALDRTDDAHETVVIFTSDHGDQCGSHGLRSKGPWNYQETMRIPLYMRVPGRTRAGTTCESLTSSVDLARTIAELAGVPTATPGLVGESLVPAMTDPTHAVRDYVLFAQQWPWYDGCEQTRYASSGIFDGRHKYCRYYGVGGGANVTGVPLPGEITFGPDSAFEDHDHEWYDLHEDPGELTNLAHDRGRRHELARRFDELRAIECAEYAPSRCDR